MRVTVRNNNIGKALSIFKKKCNEIMVTVRENEFYEKPSERRNRKKKLAIIREKKRQATT